MTTSKPNPVAGEIIDDTVEFSVTELCESCTVEAELIVEMVEYGILEPRGAGRHEWTFTGTSLRRVTTVVRLQRDLGVNMAGAALALDLMDELETLRRR